MANEKTPREQLRETLERNQENMKQWPWWMQKEEAPTTNWWRVLTLVEQGTLLKISRDPGFRPLLEAVSHRLFRLGLIVQVLKKDPNPTVYNRVAWRLTKTGEAAVRQLEGTGTERHYNVTEDPKDPESGT